jgi:hypothetical protein
VSASRCPPAGAVHTNVPFHRTNLAIILGMMQVSKKVPFDDPNVLLGVRILYVVSNLIIFGLYYYCSLKIAQKKGSEPGSVVAK